MGIHKKMKKINIIAKEESTKDFVMEKLNVLLYNITVIHDRLEKNEIKSAKNLWTITHNMVGGLDNIIKKEL